VSAGTGAFTTWWAHRYTRGLPVEVRDRRRDEIECDVFEELHAMSDGRRRSVTWRTVRGIPADVTWRRQEMRAMQSSNPEPRESHLRNAWAVVTQRWFAPVAVLVIVFDLLFAIAVIQEDGSNSGQVIGPVLLVLCALAIGTGLWMRWRVVPVISARVAEPGQARRAVSNRTIAGLFAVLAVTLALLVVGISSGSIPVFVSALGFIGLCALVFGGRAVVHALRSSDVGDRAGLADGLIIVGTFPALAMFWMIVPPILALIVIGGVLGTSPKLRAAA
jgi:hypothetical protein